MTLSQVSFGKCFLLYRLSVLGLPTVKLCFYTLKTKRTNHLWKLTETEIYKLTLEPEQSRSL